MLQPGHLLGKRYQVVKTLGQGGQSNIYLVSDTRLKGKKWVAKEMVAQYPDPTAQQHARVHFEREAQLLATLEHPNLPRVNDYFSEAGKHYLVMEYVQGQDLERMLQKRNQPFTEEEVANWAIQVATVLYYLHNQRPPIVFRDIKPSNIMIDGNMAKLIDFGIVRHFNPAKKGDTLRIGSPGYSPPEQYSGQTDPRSDIYSLGVTMHHLLTNRDPSKTATPFQLPPIKALNPNVSSKMVYIVEKATQLDPDKRYQNSLDLKNDLREVYSGGLTRVSTMPVGALTTIQSTSRTVPSLPQGAILDEEEEEEETASTSQVPAGKSQAQAPQAKTQPPKVAAPPKGAQPKKRGALIGVIILLLMLGGIGYGIYALVTGIIPMPAVISNFLHPTQTPSPTEAPDRGTPLDKAIALYNDGRHREALAELEKLREQNPRSPYVLVYVNNALAKLSGMETVSVSVLAQTGDGDLSRSSFLAGVALAQQRINFEGGIRGKQVLLTAIPMTGDSSKDAPLIDQAFDGNPLVVLTDGNRKIIQTIAKIAESRTVPVLATEARGEKGAALVTVSISLQAQMQALLQYLDRTGIKTVAVVHDAAIPPAEMSSILNQPGAGGAKITGTFSYQADKLEFDKILADIKKGNPGAIIAFGQEDNVAYFVSTARSGGVTAKICVPAYLTTAGIISRLKTKEPGMIGVQPLYYWPANFPSANFISAYRNLYEKAEPDVNSAFGYDLLQLAAFAGRRSSLENDKLLAYLEKDPGLNSYTGALGKLMRGTPEGAASTDGVFTGEWWAVMETVDGNWKSKGGFQIK